MTRYEVVRQVSPSPSWALANLERHPDQPEDGFGSWTEAELWLMERMLAPHVWRVVPAHGEAA